MMLKKQTVWLLTMLSLIIVLSVYYMTSPSPSDHMAVPTDQKDHKDKKSDDNGKTSKAKDQASNAQGKKVSTNNIAGQATFAAAELKKQESRDEESKQLTQKIASDTATAQEKAQAQEKLNHLNQLSSKEEMLESLIMAKGYKDALVNVEDNGQVRVYVKADNLSNKQATQILDLVKSHLDNVGLNVAINFKPGE